MFVLRPTDRIAFIGNPAVTVIPTKKQTAFDPSIYGTLLRWGKPDALSYNNNDLVANSTDLSGNGFHLLQATDANKPVYKTNVRAGLPALLFTPINRLASASVFGISGADARTFFWVGQQTADNGIALSIGDAGGGNQFALGRLFGGWYIVGYSDDSSFGTSDGNWHVHCVTYNGSTVEWFVDGVSVGSAGHTYATINTTLFMGTDHWGGGFYYSGYMGDDIEYKSYVTPTNRQIITSVLGERWGISVP